MRIINANSFAQQNFLFWFLNIFDWKIHYFFNEIHLESKYDIEKKWNERKNNTLCNEFATIKRDHVLILIQFSHWIYDLMKFITFKNDQSNVINYRLFFIYEWIKRKYQQFVTKIIDNINCHRNSDFFRSKNRKWKISISSQFWYRSISESWLKTRFV